MLRLSSYGASHTTSHGYPKSPLEPAPQPPSEAFPPPPAAKSSDILFNRGHQLKRIARDTATFYQGASPSRPPSPPSSSWSSQLTYLRSPRRHRRGPQLARPHPQEALAPFHHPDRHPVPRGVPLHPAPCLVHLVARLARRSRCRHVARRHRLRGLAADPPGGARHQPAHRRGAPGARTPHHKGRRRPAPALPRRPQAAPPAHGEGPRQARRRRPEGAVRPLSLVPLRPSASDSDARALPPAATRPRRSSPASRPRSPSRRSRSRPRRSPRSRIRSSCGPSSRPSCASRSCARTTSSPPSSCGASAPRSRSATHSSRSSGAGPRGSRPSASPSLFAFSKSPSLLLELTPSLPRRRAQLVDAPRQPAAVHVPLGDGRLCPARRRVDPLPAPEPPRPARHAAQDARRRRVGRQGRRAHDHRPRGPPRAPDEHPQELEARCVPSCLSLSLFPAQLF